MNKTVVFTIAALSAFASAAEAANATRPVLGFITLGQTSASEVVDAVKARGCNGHWENENYYEIASGCFSLPGNPTVGVNFFTDTKLAFYVRVSGNKGMGSETFDRYVASIKKSYGNASKLKNAYVGDRYALWKKPNVVVELNEPHMSFTFDLSYTVRWVWNQWEEEKAAKAKKGTNDLNSL